MSSRAPFVAQRGNSTMNITADDIRQAALRLRAQNDDNGPILGFSFGEGPGVTIDFDEERDIAEMCLEALAEELNTRPPRLSLAKG